MSRLASVLRQYVRERAAAAGRAYHRRAKFVATWRPGRSPIRHLGTGQKFAKLLDSPVPLPCSCADAEYAGYLLKDCALEELTLAIHMVMEDKYYLSPAITGAVLEDFLNDCGDLKTSLILLTMREREVLQMIAEGNSTRAIAENLDISTKTVETHRLRMMNKLNLRNVADLTKFALREGLTTLDF